METSLSITFTTEPQPEKDVFNPTVNPEIYDPNNPESVNNALSDCDKWIMKPWVGFSYHVPAITYAQTIYLQALANLPTLYANAKNAYNQQMLEFLANQQVSGNTSYTKTYDSPTLSISLTTNGVTSSYSSLASNPNPNTQLSIYFSPENKEDSGMGGGGENGCKLIPWEVMYEGKARWTWRTGELQQAWNNTQTNWRVNGTAPTSYAPVTGVKIKLKVGSSYEWFPFYVYYDPKYNTAQTSSYALKPLIDTWQDVGNRMQTLSVTTLFKEWYVPNPINPIPVSPERVAEAPNTFAGMVQTKEYIMKVALGYIPPSGIKDAKNSYQGGTNLNIAPFCKWTKDPAPINGQGGTMEVTAFGFYDLMHKSFKKEATIPESDWSQHGVHNFELIIMGSHGYFLTYDERSRARKELLRKTYSLSWYVPSLDRGEFLYRKRWGVFSPLDNAYLGGDRVISKIVYAKKYGHLGLKRVMEITNPFDKDIFFIYPSNAVTQPTVYTGTPKDNYFYPAIRIKADSMLRLTTYGHQDSLSNSVIIFSTPAVETLIATRVLEVIAETTYYAFETAVRDQLIAYSQTLCKLPQMAIIIDENGIQQDVLEVSKPLLGARWPIWRYDHYFGSPWSGQNCTCSVKKVGSSSPAVDKTGHYRLYSKAVADYFLRNRRTPAHRCAYIAQDIPFVYYQPHDYTRPSAWSGWLIDSATGNTFEWGGSVDTFCERTDSRTLTPLTMGNDTSQLNASSYYYAGQPAEPVYTNSTDKWDITNIVLDTTDTPTMSCVMVGRIVEGWDEKPIEVYHPNFYTDDN